MSEFKFKYEDWESGKISNYLISKGLNNSSHEIRAMATMRRISWEDYDKIIKAQKRCLEYISKKEFDNWKDNFEDNMLSSDIKNKITIIEIQLNNISEKIKSYSGTDFGKEIPYGYQFITHYQYNQFEQKGLAIHSLNLYPPKKQIRINTKIFPPLNEAMKMEINALLLIEDYLNELLEDETISQNQKYAPLKKVTDRQLRAFLSKVWIKDCPKWKKLSKESKIAIKESFLSKNKKLNACIVYELKLKQYIMDNLFVQLLKDQEATLIEIQKEKKQWFPLDPLYYQMQVNRNSLTSEDADILIARILNIESRSLRGYLNFLNNPNRDHQKRYIIDIETQNKAKDFLKTSN